MEALLSTGKARSIGAEYLGRQDPRDRQTNSERGIELQRPETKAITRNRNRFPQSQSGGIQPVSQRHRCHCASK
jgi:hypothetical protein